jgi:hypothetical protein
VPPHPCQPTFVVVCDGHCSSSAARVCVAEAQQQVSDRIASAGPVPSREDRQGKLMTPALSREGTLQF